MTTGTGAPLARNAEWPAGRQAGDRTDNGGRREDTRGSWQTIFGGEVRGQDVATAVGRMASGRAWQHEAKTPAGKAREAGVPNAEVGVHARTWGESSVLTSDTDAGGKGKDVTLGSVAFTKQESSSGPGKVTFGNSGEKGLSVVADTAYDLLVCVEGRTGTAGSWRQIRYMKAGHVSGPIGAQRGQALNVMVSQL